MLKASIDLGTNTCLLLIADWDSARQRVTRTISDTSTIVRLGQGVDLTKQLHPDAIQRTYVCLRGYASKCIQAGIRPSDVICVATATARDAENGAEFFAQIERDFGFRFRTITGDEEARFMFEGALSPEFDPACTAVIDIGGGSTELRARTGGFSLQMGSVRFTERFLKRDPVTDDEFWACREAVDQAYRSDAPQAWRSQVPTETKLVGVAGTITTLAAWHLRLTAFDSAKIDEVTLTRGDVHLMVEELKWRTIAERRELPGIEAQRADVLLAGALILWRAMEELGFPDCRVSTRGLRYGVMAL